MRLCASFQIFGIVVAQSGSVPPPSIGMSFFDAAMGSGSTQSGILLLGHGIVGKSNWKLTVTGKTGASGARQWPRLPLGWSALAEPTTAAGTPSCGIRYSGTY